MFRAPFFQMPALFEIRIGDLIVSIGAVRLENTTDWYVMPGFPAIAHRDVVWALEAACRDLGVRYHVGLTATASGFYAPQGRAMRTRRQPQPHAV